jgi:hypothetical protein
MADYSSEVEEEDSDEVLLCGGHACHEVKGYQFEPLKPMDYREPTAEDSNESSCSEEEGESSGDERQERAGHNGW